MNLLLWKILTAKQGRWQLFIAGSGFAIGLFILLISLQLHLDLKKVLTEQQSRENQSSYLVINKQVSLLNTFDKSVSAFSADEIAAIQSQEFITSVGAFRTNQFRIAADLTLQLGFSTDLFFEALPDKYIDNKPDEFRWEAEKNFVPVIVASEFLNLYNFGYSLTQSLPQLPPDAIKTIPFNITLSGNGRTKKFSARVVAFSNRIPSVLVPLDFMDWANKEFGSGEKDPSRLIIEVKDPGDERLKKFLEEKKYAANPESMRFKKAGTILKTVVAAAGATGLLFVALSLVIFILNFQLIIFRAKQEVDILMNLGYTRASISRLLNLQLLLMLLLAAALSLSARYFAVEWMHRFFSQQGVVFESDPCFPLLTGAGITLLMLLLNSISMRWSLR